ncbi:formylglycine-generating enzyme family protein [Pontibacter lucknowensis]|uniref:Formylglycine-generating enzyme, required for sulfatase activity, contains SUMF1/FGE domain n=1 Tax=Pontibacter lucknowensis TaxID=1077936 RepID=A0A1N6X073_9BACT|nr:formylglycine-generating enzyme family protein [Pontibacter lucknowensis]SIQ95718.1 Formylglycine-generating enzyme, required for sulfatase activity, contains SUMF1/FGE domain [Pontibacter lucknowensis]
MRRLLTILLMLGACSIAQAQKGTPANMVHVKGGTFVPLYGSNNQSVSVQDFIMDKYPVTNAQYEAFVAEYPKWKKSEVKALFADAGYLKHWSSDLGVGTNSDKLKDSPVINVSWFAAKAYCECQGKRLPTVNEWEFAALASETKKDASSEPSFYQRSLDWYSQPNPKYLPPVQNAFKNYYGLYGMIGLVWEWTSDFNSALIVGESRQNASLDRQLFCGAGSTGASDVKNYVAFMRYAFRSSLKANYTVANLGFRCVQDVPAKTTAKK